MKVRQKGIKEKLQPKIKSHTAKYIKHVRKRNKAKENLLKSPGINYKNVSMTSYPSPDRS